ncbi:MAG: 23S rRNA (uridine(2552)-2'-O)-methyltransferase RlmE [Rhodanobacteraceae bacterium]|nr:23S rRNA (uridine(2552)-2'-O)-methyltransferase RlmE [Rhodanobacteraceae bacterium]
MARSKSSGRWLNEHFNDPYVRRAHVEGMRSRAAYKLEELLERDLVLRPGMVVVDLGAAPGGWSQVAQEWLKGKGRVIALDILEMDPLPGVEFIHGDFTQDEVLAQLEQTLGDAKVDLVLSDMAPNMSGVASVDQARSMLLAELALDFAKAHLRRGGGYLVKLFQGEGFDAYVKLMRAAFDKVHLRKPKASRGRSREIYALATGFKDSGA